MGGPFEEIELRTEESKIVGVVGTELRTEMEIARGEGIGEMEEGVVGEETGGLVGWGFGRHFEYADIAFFFFLLLFRKSFFWCWEYDEGGWKVYVIGGESRLGRRVCLYLMVVMVVVKGLIRRIKVDQRHCCLFNANAIVFFFNLCVLWLFFQRFFFFSSVCFSLPHEGTHSLTIFNNLFEGQVQMQLWQCLDFGGCEHYTISKRWTDVRVVYGLVS